MLGRAKQIILGIIIGMDALCDPKQYMNVDDSWIE